MPKPKVISVFKSEKFEKTFLNVPMMGKPTDIFLECRSYDLGIPVKGQKKRQLDIFEETILRMIQLKKCSMSELADILCVEKDLIHFIILRMIENGLLLDNQTISEKGKLLLDSQTNTREELEYIQGKLFIVKKTGLIMPYLHIGEFQSENVEDFDKYAITIGFGSTGNHKTIYGKCIRNTDKESKLVSVLDTRLLKRTINKYNKIASIQNKPQINLNEEYAISSSLSENIYFHLQAVVQEGNVDEVMFSDGFVPNIDGILDYVRSENPELLSYIKSKAVNMSVLNNDESSEVYRSQRYQEIYHLYSNAQKYLQEYQYDKATVDERTDINEGKKQIITDCYHMIEWAFYYYIRRNRLSQEMYNLLYQRSFSANKTTLIQFANSLGFRNISKCSNLFAHIDGRRMYSVDHFNSPELYVCLPMAIAEAKENTNSEIHSVIQKNRNVLSFINMLNDICAGLRHDSELDAIEMDTNMIMQETYMIITTILPDILFENSSGNSDIYGNASRDRLLAQVSVEKALGYILFSTMKKGLRNDWLKISPDKKGNRLPGAREYIEILYRILQAELFEANKELLGKEEKSKDEALAVLSSRYSRTVPKSFSRVRELYYTNAANDVNNSTLGAEALVYIANVDDHLANALMSLNYVSVLDRVLRLRGHGDMVSLNETEQSLNDLREDVIKLSRVIGGCYD